MPDWLTRPPPDAPLSREQLEEWIENLLAGQCTAVIATVAADGSPAATPVRYGHLGLEVMYTSWNDSPKSRNLRRDPRVSVGIVAPLVGLASSRGAQIFGTARTLEHDDPEADRYWAAFRWQSDHAERGRSLDEPPSDPMTVITPTRIVYTERGRSLDEPPSDPMTVITPTRIVYTEHWLRRSGHRPRQTWHAHPA